MCLILRKFFKANIQKFCLWMLFKEQSNHSLYMKYVISENTKICAWVSSWPNIIMFCVISMFKILVTYNHTSFEKELWINKWLISSISLHKVHNLFSLLPQMHNFSLHVRLMFRILKFVSAIFFIFNIFHFMLINSFVCFFC